MVINFLANSTEAQAHIKQAFENPNPCCALFINHEILCFGYDYDEWRKAKTNITLVYLLRAWYSSDEKTGVVEYWMNSPPEDEQW